MTEPETPSIDASEVVVTEQAGEGADAELLAALAAVAAAETWEEARTHVLDVLSAVANLIP